MIDKNYINDLSFKIIGCAIEVHKHLGPGLLESVYHKCLFKELKENNLEVESEVLIPIRYKEVDIESNLRIDLLVDDLIIFEIKVVDEIHPVHKAQLLSYLRLTKNPKGILFNFHTTSITQSMISFVGETFKKLK